jgi:predicted transposase YdaD
MSAPVHQPHDSVVRGSFTDIRVARNFFENYFQDEIKKRVNFGTLSIMNASFLDEQLQKTHSDILYQATLLDAPSQPIYFYLLLEAQSTPDCWMRAP